MAAGEGIRWPADDSIPVDDKPSPKPITTDKRQFRVGIPPGIDHPLSTIEHSLPK